MSSDDYGILFLLCSALAIFYGGLYKLGVFYRVKEITKVKDDYERNLHKPHFFGDDQ